MKPLIAPRMVLIGGAGFIGHHVAKAARAAGMDVLVIDSTLPQESLEEDGVSYIKCDYADKILLEGTISSGDYVIHLAHEKIRLDIVCNMTDEITRNILPAVQLMEVCCRNGVASLLFVSSGGTVYGNREIHEPIEEVAETRPVSVYGNTKLMIEQLGLLYHIQAGLPFIIARPANAYGPGQLPFRGQGIIATALASAIQNKPVVIYGDGSVVRDYVYVEDIANAFLALLLYGKPGQAYNVGTSVGISLIDLVTDYIQPLLTSNGIMLDCRFEEGRSADVDYNVLDCTKMQADTGFKAKVDLDKGLLMTWEWLRVQVTNR